MKERFWNSPWPVKVLFFLLMGFLFLLVFSSIVYFLWNAILPKISPLKEITLVQAGGLLILSKILFGSMHWGKNGRKARKKNWEHWGRKWQSMSEEDKMRMKERWRERCAKKKEDQ